MTEIITIDKDVPLPSKGNNAKYPFPDMEVGDSFFAANAKAALHSAVNQARKRLGMGFKVRKRIENGVPGYRIWRVAALLLTTVAAAPAWAWDKPECTRNQDASSCYVAQPVTGGKTVRRQIIAIGVIRSGEMMLGMFCIFDDTWKMPKRDKVQVTVSIDAFAPVERFATTDGTMLRLLLPMRDLAALANGSVVSVASPGFTESYDLAGSRRAIEGLGEAWKRHVGGGGDPFASTTDPFAGQPQGTPAVDPLAEQVRRFGT